MKIYLSQRKVESSYHMAVLADEYTINNRKGKIKLGYAQPNYKPTHPNKEICDSVYTGPWEHPPPTLTDCYSGGKTVKLYASVVRNQGTEL